MIRRDGTIAFRQIAEEKDDRLDSAQLLRIADDTLGTTGKAARSGYAVLTRLQLGVESAVAIGDSTGYGANVRLGLPTTRLGFAAVHVGYNTVHTVEAAGSAGLRVPLLADTAAVQLTVLGGSHGTAPFGAARLGLWLAWTPQWAVQLDGGASIERQFTDPAITFTLGVSRLISWR